MSLALRRGHRRRLVLQRGTLADGTAPLEALQRLDVDGATLRRTVAFVAALAAHTAFAVAAMTLHTCPAPASPAPRAPLRATLQRATPKPALPPEPARPADRSPPLSRERPVTSSTPPAPAQVGRVVAQDPDTSAPLDMTSFDLVVGKGAAYAGGYSSAAGTSQHAVLEHGAKTSGVPDARPAPTAPPPAPDLSRPASPLHRDWACAWPEDAQDSELRDARVTVRVSVDPSGLPSRIAVLSAPPGGFAEAAQSCAGQQRYRPALDAAGNPLAADTPLLNVHFVR